MLPIAKVEREDDEKESNDSTGKTAGYELEVEATQSDGESAFAVPNIRVHTRWLPIFSGVFCPFSVMLEISGLTSEWYVKLEDSNTSVVETQPNPPLLTIALAISLTLGVIANVALISRFLERRPWSMTILASAALTIHDMINIAVVTAFGVIHSVSDGFD